MLVVLATWETEIGRIMVWGYSQGKKQDLTLINKWHVLAHLCHSSYTGRRNMI
jgi:hypothetical protein